MKEEGKEEVKMKEGRGEEEGEKGRGKGGEEETSLSLDSVSKRTKEGSRSPADANSTTAFGIVADIKIVFFIC